MREEDMLIKQKIPETTDPSEWEVIGEQISFTESLGKLGRAWRALVLVKEIGIIRLLNWLCKRG